MTDRRLQFEHEHSLSAAVRTWLSTECGKVNRAYAEKRHTRLQAHHAFHDRLRDERQALLLVRPRTQIVTEQIARLEDEIRAHRRAPPPDMSDLEAERRARIEALDVIARRELASIRNRAVRGELDCRLQWSEAEQKFVIPSQEPANA